MVAKEYVKVGELHASSVESCVVDVVEYQSALLEEGAKEALPIGYCETSTQQDYTQTVKDLWHHPNTSIDDFETTHWRIL